MTLEEKAWIPPWMSRTYRGIRGTFPVAFLESFIFSSTIPYVMPSAFRRMSEWHWDKGTPQYRTVAMGLGTTLGTTLSVIPPIVIGIEAYNGHPEYAIGYVLVGAMTNIVSDIYEAVHKKDAPRKETWE